MEKLASRNVGVAASARRNRLQREKVTAEVVADATAALENAHRIADEEEVARVAHELLLDAQLTQYAGADMTTQMISSGKDMDGALLSISSSSMKENVTTTPIFTLNVTPPQPGARAAVTAGNMMKEEFSSPPSLLCTRQEKTAPINSPPVSVVFTTEEGKITQPSIPAPTKRKTTAATKRQLAKSKVPPLKKKRKTKGCAATPTAAAVIVPVTRISQAKKSAILAPGSSQASSETGRKKNNLSSTKIKVESETDSDSNATKKKEGPKTHINGVPLPMGNDAESRRQRRLIRNRMSAQLHRERKREAIENYQKQVEERDQEIEELRSEVEELKSKNLSLSEMISKIRENVGEDVFLQMIGASSNLPGAQVLSPQSPPHLVNESDQSTVSPPSPYEDRSSGSDEETDALSTVPSSPVSCSSPLHHHGEVVKDMRAPSEFALTMSSGPGDVVIGKRRRDVPSGRSVCQDSLTGKTSQGRGRKKKSRTSSTSLLTLSSVAICGVLGCIALVTSPNSLRLSSFAPSWHVHDRSFSVEKDGAMDARADGDSAHRRLTVDENLDDFEGTLGENDGSAPREDSSIKISQGMVPAVTTTTRSWVISPLELHPERWTIRHNRPWTVQNSFVLFDKSVESSGPPSLTYQEALRQQLCRVLLTTDALYPSTMGTMAVLCSPVASRMLPLPPPLPKTNSSEARDLVTRSFSSQSQTMSTPKPIINIKKNDEVPSMKPARLRGAFSGNNSLTDDLSDIIDEESNIDTTEVDPDRSSDHYYMESSPSSGFFATSLSSRSLLHPGRGQQLQNDDKTLGENKSGKENEDHTRHYGQNEDKSGGQNNTSFLFCPSAFASVSPDFFEMIGNGVSIYDNRSKNSDWNSREENVRFDGVFNDIDLDFSDFDNEDDESNVLLNNYQEEPRQVDDTPLFGVETDVLIGNSYDEEDGHNLNLKGVDHEDPNDYNSEYVDGENMSSGHSKLWIKNDRDGEREDETKALVPTFGQKGDPYGTQRSLFSDKRVAQASVIGHSNDQYSNMVILVPLSAVHGNGSGTFREGYEDIPISEQPWIELDCFINSVRIVDGIEFVSDGTIRDDHV